MSTKKAQQKVVVILGPTASGKSTLAVELAKKYNGEIISADSRQIYKGMDIASGKISKKEMRGIKHHLLDIALPNKVISVAQWQKLANTTIKKILARKKLPIVCGGTGLYISALVNNFNFPPGGKLSIRSFSEGGHDTSLRMRLEQKDIKELFLELKKIDPKTAKTIDKKNKRRLVRALEVAIKTGQSFRDQQIKSAPQYEFLQIGIDIPRDELFKKINKRVDEMIKEGLFREAKKLLKKYKTTLPSMSGIGYKEIERFFNKELNEKGKPVSQRETIEYIKSNTRHYSKRQITWFIRDQRIRWIGEPKEVEKLVNEFLAK